MIRCAHRRLPGPRHAAAHAAVSLAERYQSTAMTAHAVRSWYWAVGFAALDRLDGVDHELLWVAAVLHDIGTVTEFDAHTVSYEHAGGHVAVALTTGAGWTVERQQRVLDVIVRHNWASVDVGLDLEGHLLERATGLDVSGTGYELLPSRTCARSSHSTPAARSPRSSARASSTRHHGSPTPRRAAWSTAVSSRSSRGTRSRRSPDVDARAVRSWT